MFAIIKDNEIIGFSDTIITKDNMDFDEIIEWNFDIQKQYIYCNWLVINKEILEEKKQAESCGYECEIVDGVLIKKPTEASRNFEISEKIKKIDEIEKQIRSLWETETSSVFLQNVNTTRVSNLRAEKTALESELDEMTLDLDQSVIDQIIASIF